MYLGCEFQLTLLRKKSTKLRRNLIHWVLETKSWFRGWLYKKYHDIQGNLSQYIMTIGKGAFIVKMLHIWAIWTSWVNFTYLKVTCIASSLCLVWTLRFWRILGYCKVYRLYQSVVTGQWLSCLCYEVATGQLQTVDTNSGTDQECQKYSTHLIYSENSLSGSVSENILFFPKVYNSHIHSRL